MVVIIVVSKLKNNLQCTASLLELASLPSVFLLIF